MMEQCACPQLHIFWSLCNVYMHIEGCEKTWFRWPCDESFELIKEILGWGTILILQWKIYGWGIKEHWKSDIDRIINIVSLSCKENGRGR